MRDGSENNINEHHNLYSDSMNQVPLKPFVITVPVKNNSLLQQALDAVNTNEEIRTLWDVINTNAIERMSMTDHGPVHFQIVSNIALKLLRMLVEHKVTPSIVKDFKLTNDHAELVVLLASLLHDTGMSINRDGHEEFSLFIANQLLREVLVFLPVKVRTIVISDTLHAIINHRSGGKPVTLEGGILRVADALDMSEGRSRIPFDLGKINIHSLSALAIEQVLIRKGTKKPITIDIVMNNSAGIFQIDQLLRSKLKNSGIEDYISVKAYIGNENEKKLMSEIAL